MHIRRASTADADTIHSLICQLAEYERALDEVQATPESLIATLFTDDPHAFCDLVEEEGEVVGMAIWFLNYSTWQSKYGIYLEDLFVPPAHRGKGYGLALLRHLANLCVQNDYGRFQWSVLDWNQPAIDFYRQIGANPLNEWVGYRLTGEALRALATS